MVDTYRFFIDAGSDVVINHHQHCFSGYELYKDKPIFYGLGNFCFDSKSAHNEKWSNGYSVILDYNNSSFSFDLVPYIQCTNSPKVELLDDSCKEAFYEKLTMINEIIADRIMLQEKLDTYLDNVKEGILLNLEPISNRYLRALQRRGMWPRLLKGKSLFNWCNRIRCESHNEVLLQLLLREIKNIH